jgi:UDP-glucose 4-epimerase
MPLNYDKVDNQIHGENVSPGDVVGSYTRSTKAASMLGWSAQRTVQDGIRDALAWLERRPEVLGH